MPVNNTTPETTTSASISEAQAQIAELDASLDAAEQEHEVPHEEQEAESKEFVHAFQNLEKAKRLLNGEPLSAEYLDEIIGNLIEKRSTEMNTARLEALQEAISSLEDVRRRVGLGEGNDLHRYTSIARNYANLLSGGEPAGDSAVQSDLAIARNDFRSAVTQMRNDTKAYVFVHRYLAASTSDNA